MDVCEFQASLVYIVSSRQPGICREALSINKMIDDDDEEEDICRMNG